MPVHNALPHLDEAIESILGQTFREFEFVVLDDASTDGSSERLRYWAAVDSRIRLLRVDENLGPVASSNRVAEEARAPFVARMDADDISYPERLAEQLAVLRRHDDVGVVGSLCDTIDGKGRKLRGPEFWRLSRRSAFVPFAHGSMMYRREIFEKAGGYRNECVYWEDQDLVVRMAAIARVAVIPRALYRVRQSTTSTRIVCTRERMEGALQTVFQATDRLEHGLPFDDLLSRSEPAPLKLLRRFLSRAQMSWNGRTASALIWTAWASLSPSTLRAFLLMLLKARNRFPGRQLVSTSPVVWEPMQKPVPIVAIEPKQ
jgi:glycosyltransferase involved in cell wall biosynthesis